MTDTVRPEYQVARLALVRDDELAGLESGPAARQLLATLMVEQPPSDASASSGYDRGWLARRPVRALLAVGALSLAVAVGVGVLEDRTGRATSYANAAIDVRVEGDFVVARIKDPLANHARYVEAFRAVGKNVDIQLVPVSPDRVGSLLAAGGAGPGQVRAATDLVGSGTADCAATPASCTMEIRISADTGGSVWYRIGRAARPGEVYQDPHAAPGEHAVPGGSSTDGPSTGGASTVGSSGEASSGTGE